MKTRHLLLTLAGATALPLVVLLPVTSSAKPEAPAKAKNKETREIKVRDGVKLTFEAEVLDDKTEAVWIGSGYINYKGKVYTGGPSPPRCILTSGILEVEGKKIVLDVSGISNPWIKPEELRPQDVHVEIRTEKLHATKSGKSVASELEGEVEVFFIKGGADDHLVHWAIQGEASLRTSIENRDYPADWQEVGMEFSVEPNAAPPKKAAEPAPPKGPLLIDVSKEGEIKVYLKKMDAEKLGALLKEHARFNPKHPVVICAEKETKYESILLVLNAAHEAGLYHLSFASAEP